MDRKGIAVYLVLIFALSYVLIGLAFRSARLEFLAYGLLLAPGIAAFVAERISPTPPESRSAFRPIRKASVVRIAMVVPCVFIVILFLNMLLRVGRPDWYAGELMAQLRLTYENMGWPQALAPQEPSVAHGSGLLAMGFVFSLVLGPTLYAVAFLPTECGWRAYLLPRLMPLGRWRAYALTGLLWGASCAPVFVRGAENRLEGTISLLRFLAVTVVLSIMLGEMWRRSRHLGMAAVCCGCFVCQASTIWQFVYPVSYLRPYWGGPTGLVAIAVWGVAALVTEGLFGNLAVASPEEPRT